MRIGVKPGQWGWSFVELEASWQAAEEAGFDHVSCFDWATAAPRGLACWDAPALLVAMAARTELVALRVTVLNLSLRHPFLLAGQLAVAQALSRDRLTVGVGAGAAYRAQHDNRALRIPFPPLAERVARLEACCRALPALWRGEEVTEPALGLARASLGPIGIREPALVVGGGSRSVMKVAARHAAGWDSVEEDPGRFAVLVRQLDDACREVGRDRPIERNVQVFADFVEASALAESLAGLGEAGATSVTLILHRERGPAAIRRLAEAVLA